MRVVEVLDLSMEIYHNYPGNPMLPPTRVDVTHNFAVDGFKIERIDTPTHAGTHIDAPSHVLETGVDLDAWPIDSFFGWATAVDQRKKGPREPIGPQDFAGLNIGGGECDFVLLYTGWGDKLGYTKEYVFDSPWLSEEGARCLAGEGVKGVGIDHMSVSGMDDEHDRPTHETLLGTGIVIIEGLVFTPRILERERWFLIALPMRLKGVSGAPARVVALGLEG